MDNAAFIQDISSYINSNDSGGRQPSCLSHAHPVPAPTRDVIVRIRMRCGHRKTTNCLPQGHRPIINNTCAELCLRCDRIRVLELMSQDRRHLAALDRLTRQVHLGREPTDFQLLAAKLQWIAVQKAGFLLRISERSARFRQRWHTQSESLPVPSEEDVQRGGWPGLENILHSLERSARELEGIILQQLEEREAPQRDFVG